MAIDTVQKAMSAIMPGLPWRGPLVDATDVGFTVGNSAAALFMYATDTAPASLPIVGKWCVHVMDSDWATVRTSDEGMSSVVSTDEVC